MFNRFMLIAIFVPLAIILIALAVANRELVAFTLDPFNPGNPKLTLTLPLFIFLFLALAIGMIIGSLATWVKQGRYRKLARQRGVEAENLRQAVSRAPAVPQSQAPGSAQGSAQGSALPKPTA
ncbi:MAG: LapA family protein [Mesorhizobium sp.]|uniref:LapA family protein n=1 Tax=unclassified Mesorhizobium TaxID=325217 RepID=UPI000FD3B4B0|nr:MULTISPECIES: LapA family protein [unclassified Mesorhizobium]AZV20110.1 LapA family protein [Mesorhizobium sp. M7A.F.Ce.TU.012.03.2.1]RVD11045.1 LapA family protein [Mesorhizobium sp. M7A.F.Ca.ET.027.02.1.1]RWD08705.1 MAG: LapA family protein [Mesorhizobium sp.]RWO72554.1 MAG: LapA family protein [Mesorhizobium sp.]RWP09844.1 MAG: LapA family protein [Mesorhizobium sp.]